MLPEPPITSIAHAIELAVAPVFLLTGVGALLNVLSSRLGRIIDRARLLEGGAGGATPVVERELRILSRRARLINRAIALSTGCALLICTLIGAVFLAVMAAYDVTMLIALLFVAAMLALIVALFSFLREVYLATANLRIGPP